MCEGLLRLTVDRIFPAPLPPASNVDVDDGSLDLDTSTKIDASGAASCSEARENHARRFGKWRPITKAPPPSPHNHNQSESSFPPDARGGVRNPSALVFSLSGRHLTRRSLARAERGVREATAVNVLTVWWRSIADERQKTRSRRLCAMAQIGAWAIKIAARRRRRALRSKSARVIQARWRRAREVRSLAARMAACVVVQTVWRQWKCKRRRTSRRVRRRVFSGLRSWARSVLSRRQSMARMTIIRVIVAAVTRHATKRHSAAVIMRGLETTCSRRRQSRLRLQRFARVPCLLRVRLAALSLARVDRVQRRAVSTITGAFRRALARSAVVRAALAARTLQLWSRRVLWRWEKRSTSTVTIQLAWRQRRIRQSVAVPKQPPRKSAVKTVADGASTSTNVQVCAGDPRKLVAADGAVVLDISGSENMGQVTPRRQANSVPLAGHLYPLHCSPPDKSIEENNTHSLRVPVDGENGTPLALCDQLVSPATTTPENWTNPDPCLADGSVQSYRSHVSGDGSLSCNEIHCATTVVTARRSPPLLRKGTPRTAGRGGGGAMATREGSRGILDLETILPDFIKRREKVVPSEGKERGWSESSRQNMQLRDSRYRATADGSRGFGDGRTMPVFRSRDEGLPYPPAGGTQLIGTRAKWTTRRWSRTQGGEGRVGVAMKPASERFSKGSHRGKAAGSFHCRSPPRNSGCRSATKGDGDSLSIRWNKTPVKEVPSGGTGAKNRRSRVGPSSRRAGAKTRGLGVQGASDSLLGSRVRWKGDSGGVLEMLAFMEA